jgi:hypothetical protein
MMHSELEQYEAVMAFRLALVSPQAPAHPPLPGTEGVTSRNQRVSAPFVDGVTVTPELLAAIEDENFGDHGGRTKLEPGTNGVLGRP